MYLPAIMLMPSPSTSYGPINGHTYNSDGNGFVYNALIADIPGLTALGGVTIAPRNNATNVNPTSSNDFTQLYGLGSLWENFSSQVLYMCTAMGGSPGSATWTALAASSGTLIGDGSAVTVKPTGSSTARSLANLFADQYNNVKTFGAAGNGSADDTSAILAAITEAASNGAPVYFPPGTYKVTSSIAVDFNTYALATTGIKLIGAGMQESIIDGSATGGFTTLAIYYSGGTAPSSRKSAFFSSIQDLGIKANYSGGPAFRLGQADTSDALNSFEIRNVWVLNTNTGSGSSLIGTQVNFVLDTVFSNLVSNTGGHGKALQLNSTQFCTFVGGSFSTAQTGVHITNTPGGSNSFTFGNDFLSPDIENIVANCVLIDISNGEGHNSFYGGQFVWNFGGGSSYAISSSATTGSSTNDVLSPPTTRFFDVNFAPAHGSGALYGGLVSDPSNYTGVQIFGGNYGDGVTPASGTPSTGTTYTNTSGQAQTVSMYSTLAFTVQINPAISGPSITVGGSSSGTDSNSDTVTINWGGSTTIVIRPGYSLKVTSASGTVNWLWFPLAS